MSSEFFSVLNSCLEEESEIVIVTLVKTKGSAPQEVGAKMIVGTQGLRFGTVGGGKVETRAIEHALSMMGHQEKSNDFQEWNLQTDIKMTCGGVVTFYFEKISPEAKWNIAVFGAGHVAQELIANLIRLDCNIVCSDPRTQWIEKLPSHKRLKKIVTDNMSELISNLRPDTFIVSMTMGHAFDLPILREALNRDCFPYIGAIGSQSKSLVLKRDLLQAGVKSEFIEKLICPIGEEFGNNTPVEIAISVTAQLLKVRDRQ